MPRPNMQSLEHLVRQQKFAILDASALCYNSLGNIQHIRKLTQDTSDEITWAEIWYGAIPSVLEQSISFVTKEVIEELDDGVITLRATIKRNTKLGAQKTHHCAQGQQVMQLSSLYETARETIKALKERQLFFNQDTVYKMLFSFFKALLPLVKNNEKKVDEARAQERTGYKHYGDESVCASALYFTFTGENNVDDDHVTTAVISHDSDIRKGIKTAIFLFRKAIPAVFTAMMSASPIKIYSACSYNPRQYALRFNTQKEIMLCTPTEASEMLGANVHYAQSLANQAFFEVMDYLSAFKKK